MSSMLPAKTGMREWREVRKASQVSSRLAVTGMPWMRVRGVMTSRTTVSPKPTTLRMSSRSSSSRIPSASPSSRRAVTPSSVVSSSSASRVRSCTSRSRSTNRASGATTGASTRCTTP